MHAVFKQEVPREVDFHDRAESALNSPLTVTWERSAEMQIRRLLGQHAGAKPTRPLMIAVVGIPGAGKSTCSNALRSFLEDMGCLVFPHVSIETDELFRNFIAIILSPLLP